MTIIEMAYIISRNNRFYVVAHDGVDPATGPRTQAMAIGWRVAR